MPRLSFSSNGGGGGGDTNDSGNLTLGTRFSCKAAGGKLVGYRFRYPWGGVTAPDNVGTFGLYDAATQTQVAEALVTGVTLKKGDSYNGGWYTIDLPTPVDLVQNKEYVATVYMPGTMRSMSRPALNGTTQPDRGHLDHLGCRFVVNGSAAMAWPSNTSSAYYLIEPVVLVGNKVTFTGVEGDWAINYANSSQFLADNWSFTTPAGVNTASGSASFSASGVTITPNASGTADVIHRQLPSDWTSVVVKMVANPQNVAGRTIRFGLVNSTETMYLGIDSGGVPSNGGSSPYDQTSSAWYMNDRGYNLGDLADLGAGVPRWLRIDRDPVTELLTYMFSLNGLDWLIPVYGHTQNDIELATRIPHNIDANTLYIAGTSPNAWTYRVENISIQGTPDPLPVAQGELKLPDGRIVKKIYRGSQQIGKGYRGSSWVFQPTMDGEYVEFDVTGPSFRPKIGLIEGSTAQCLWTLDDNKVMADGLNPTLDFKVSGERKVRLYVRNGNLPAFDEVSVLNLGYDNTEDAGTYGPGPAHNYPPQPVTAITNLLALSNLEMFMAAHSTLLHVPFTGMSNLLYIECFHAEVQEVDLTGCDSLMRLCLEQTRVPTVDLNPVKATLRDIRYAAIRGLTAGPAGLAPLTGAMSLLYHYCIRNNQGFTGNLSFDQMPVVEERWDWECGFTTIEGTIPSTLRSYDTHGNPYLSAEMDQIYMGLDAAGRTNGFLFVQAGEQTPEAPGSSGVTARDNLIAKGWAITS